MRFCISVAPALMIEDVIHVIIPNYIIFSNYYWCDMLVSCTMFVPMLHSFALVLLVHCFVCVQACHIYVAYAALSCKINWFLHPIIACSCANCG